MSYADELRDTIDAMFAATVVPRRSVNRIRRALSEGRDVEPYLEDIEQGMVQVWALMTECEARATCPTCGGTGTTT